MDKALRDKGLANRKAVLGEDYVNKALAAADDFNGPFQEILNEYCWGLIWGDERLPKKTRSMLNLVMLACLGRMHGGVLSLRYDRHGSGPLARWLAAVDDEPVIGSCCGFGHGSCLPKSPGDSAGDA